MRSMQPASRHGLIPGDRPWLPYLSILQQEPDMYATASYQQDFDQVIQDIVDYVLKAPSDSPLAYETARHCLIDSLGCALEALEYPACTKLLGPIVTDTMVPHGARVPGTQFVLDPVKAAFDIGTMVRWLDFNDTWLAAEWGHPSDNLGAILSVADWLSRQEIGRASCREGTRRWA